MLLHVPPLPTHFENPERISTIFKKIEGDRIFERCRVYGSERMLLKAADNVHDDDYVLRILGEKGLLEEHLKHDDMYICDGTKMAILFAAGAAIKACQMVADGRHEHAFAIVRPPGHHAKERKESGFCFFNNVAIAAKYLKERGMKKILIIDWDIHFGDGTEEIFREDPDVLFISMHRYPFKFPFAGDFGERSNIGVGKGKGFNCNITWPSRGVGNDDIYAVMDYVVLPLAIEFNPYIILISGGFDAAFGDPVGDCYLTPTGYATALYKLLQLQKGVVIILEGGYDVDMMAECCLSCVKVLAGDISDFDSNNEYVPLKSTWEGVLELKSLLKAYWDSLGSEIPEEILSRSEEKHPKPKIKHPIPKT